MANNKNNINELVSDEDPTAELEAITFRQDHLSSVEEPLESDEHTSDLGRKVGDDAQTIGKLQYGIEQLRARWLGLQAEIQAREEVTVTLTTELNELRECLGLKNALLDSREAEIESLKFELQEQEARYLAAAARQEEKIGSMRKAARSIPKPPPSSSTQDDEPFSQNRLLRTEAYADSLRRKLQDLLASHDKLERENAHLEASVQRSHKYGEQLTAELAVEKEDKDALDRELASIADKHAEEIRLLRFELGEAQDTVVQSEELNSQLASDLVDTRGFKKELERMLCDNDEKSRVRIDELEKELVRARRIAKNFEERLEARSDAINVLLAELARKSERIDSIGEIGDVISDIDERISEQFDEVDDTPVPANRTNERVTRVLLGKVGNKLLRFPLFKDRLTIGRTMDNDIHLNATYISRRHAVVQADGDATRVIDWGSRNGVFVNSKRITEHFLKNGDIVTIGNVHFRYEERPKRDT
ncbi:MAG: FHA domain-containing protein [Gammaproteobacteria bacterium]|jgi:chromosome segregation ATPase|nr:FHA domain-containing protein [Gammaproteobacteria bacterium]MDH3983806.1 FHA domain-containing protein [Gammaproteobacteria bacterium]